MIINFDKYCIFILKFFEFIENKKNYEVALQDETMIEIVNIENYKDFFHIYANKELSKFHIQKKWGKKLLIDNVKFNNKLKAGFLKLRKKLNG